MNIFRGLMIVVSLAALSACKDPNASSGSSNEASPSASVKPLCDAPPAAATGLTDAGVTALKIEDVSVGTGAEATAGKTVVVNYIGRLANGTQFDASCDRKQPFDFPLGAGAVIKGWDQGVAGMKVGGQRRLIIPSTLGYGAQGAGGVIPPNAALVFDVELVEVK
jgi:FKBP-type peptidyl-prolyl cis-trans isomerase